MNNYSQVLLLLTVLGSVVFLYNQNQSGYFQQNDTFEFDLYLKTYGLKFDATQYKYRLSVYQDNKKFIQTHNEEVGYEAVGINAYAHLTHKEFVEAYLKSDFKNIEHELDLGKTFDENNNQATYDYPETVDWVAKGIIPEPTNQGSFCKGSYAISAANAVSSLYMITEKPSQMTTLSSQQIIDCQNIQGGCRGGSAMYSFLYAMTVGLVSDETYPYTKSQKSCKLNTDDIVYQTENFYKIKSSSPEVMKYVTQFQPIVSELYSGEQSFQFYRGGDKPYTSYCDPTKDPDLYVLITGYNTVDKPYWTIQTSLGTSWGNQGYMNIDMQPKGNGQCSMYRYVYFPGNSTDGFQN